MKLKRIVIFLAVGKTTTVHGCDPQPPCGIVAKDIQLTEKPGIVHVVLAQHEECSPDPNEINWNNSQELNLTKIEVGVETGIVLKEIDQPWNASSIFPNGLDTLPTVDQSRYSISFEKSSGSVVVTGETFGSRKLIYNLPGFVFPSNKKRPKNVIWFYSDKMERMFFVYKKGGNYGQFSISSCTTKIHSPVESKDLCVNTNTKLNLWSVAMSNPKLFSKTKVYDSLQLVGLPNAHSCGGYSYYKFNERTLFKSVQTLNKVFIPTTVDSRTGFAYSVEGGRDKAILVKAEKIVNKQPAIYRMKSRYRRIRVRIQRSTLKASFNGSN